MDGRMNHWAESEEHMWLRYATQVNAKGRTFTIEVSVPIPLGASAERREQLLQEADINISQLVQHVERHVPQAIQRALASNNAIPAQPARPSVPSKPINQVAPVPAPPAITQPSQPVRLSSGQVREAQEQIGRAAPQNAEAVPSADLAEAASIEFLPDLPGDNSGNLLLPQFIQYIRGNLGLSPKQAMELLKVKTLSGVNLRDALEQLRHLVGQGGADTSRTNQPARETASSAPQLNNRSRDSGSEVEHNNLNVRRMREVQPRVFDEEDDPDEDEEMRDEFDEDASDEFDLSRELTMQQRTKAKAVLSRLRESRGATTASASRLQALSNVADTQLSAQQMQELVEEVWGVTSLKKLKVDQVEALISWAKEDDFVSDAEAVLLLLEEE